MPALLLRIFDFLNNLALFSYSIFSLFFIVSIISAISNRHSCPQIFQSFFRNYQQSTSSPFVIFRIMSFSVILRFLFSFFLNQSSDLGFWTFGLILVLLSLFSSYITSISASDYADLADSVTKQATQKLSSHHHKNPSFLNQIVPRRKDKLLSLAEENLARLERTVSDQVDLLERDLPESRPSAKPIIMEMLQPYLQNNIEDAKTWGNDFDYAKTARILIFNIAFDSISSGKYNLYTGIINPMSAGPNLLTITQRCLDWAYEHGHITAEEKESTLKTLHENIRFVG